MNTRRLYIVVIACLTFLLGSCQLIGDIFKAGVWTGILAVVGIIVLIGIIIYNIFGKSKS